MSLRLNCQSLVRELLVEEYSAADEKTGLNCNLNSELIIIS